MARNEPTANPSTPIPVSTFLRIIGPVWGIGGILALLGSACWRLSVYVDEAFTEYFLSWYHWLFLVVWVIFMLINEGDKGFRRAFSPRVVARAQYLFRHPNALHTLLAPLFCMGFFHATRKRKIVAWVLTSCMVALVLLVRQIPQPWRGLIDVGVVLGLAYGMVFMCIYAWQAVFTNSFERDPEVVETRLGPASAVKS